MTQLTSIGIGNVKEADVTDLCISIQDMRLLRYHEEDVLTHITALPPWVRLSLTNAYVGKQLCFSTGFAKLTSLEIRNFAQLNKIIIEKEVMPNLKSLRIDSCMELKIVPEGIEYLQNLQELDLESVSRELENRIYNEDFPKVQHIPKLRCFLVFDKTLKSLPSGSKLLRVLDLEDAPIDELPDEVFKLFNLRYLNLRRTLLKKLPNSIGRLLNLQTLDIFGTQIETLPHGIGKLQNL
ncbi:disease resistance protein rpm1 [Quercus suber]|uniref:Disease resistance protein rpm1 n=1 Tax=Quercus suber TaxID=58331 RepID=A0AAW0KCY7_QUESU